MDNPYQEGFRACLAGHTLHQNPYAPFTRDHSDWQEGWKEQDRHQAAKDSALDSIGWFG